MAKGNRDQQFRQRQQQKAKGQQQISSRQQRRQGEQKPKQSKAQAKKAKLQEKLRVERNIAMGKLSLKRMGSEKARIAMASTRQAWQGVEKPQARMRAIYETYKDEIEGEFGGNIGQFLEAKIAGREEIIEAAFNQDIDYLRGKGWSDEDLKALSNCHSQEEIYELLKDLGYYD